MYLSNVYTTDIVLLNKVWCVFVEHVSILLVGYTIDIRGKPQRILSLGIFKHV